jgi:RNA polymerase sigma-70 factor, ECF subfamily
VIVRNGQSEDGQVIQDKADNALVEQAARGDGDSFTELCRRFYPALVAISHAITGDRHLAEDAAQQALAKAAVNLPKLRRPEQFGAWLAAICRNAATDIVRRRASAPERLDTDAASGELVARTVNQQDGAMCEAVRSGLMQLPAKVREAVYLKYYDGLTYGQMSAVLGISEQAINGRLRRAKRTLEKYLRQQGFDEAQI